jgi:hypothetical protein
MNVLHPTSAAQEWYELLPEGIRASGEGAYVLWSTLSMVVRMPCLEQVKQQAEQAHQFALQLSKASAQHERYFSFRCSLGRVTCWWPEGVASQAWVMEIVFIPFDPRDAHAITRGLKQERAVHLLWQALDPSLVNLECYAKPLFQR